MDICVLGCASLILSDHHNRKLDNNVCYILFLFYETHCSKTRFNPNVPQLTSSLQIIITHIYISHFIDFLKKITESILKNGHFYDFWAVLARFGIFGPFFFVFLGNFKYFLDTEHHGGWPRVNLIFCTFFIFGRFWIFGPFFGFWLQWRFGAFLGMLVSYKMTRGITLVVGGVIERLSGVLGGSRGVWEGLGGLKGGQGGSARPL